MKSRMTSPCTLPKTFPETLFQIRMLAALALLAAASAPAAAQTWPERPLTMVIPFAAGGAVDIMGRILAARLGEVLGQRVIIENIGGAGGMSGAYRVAKAAPDGYEFVLGSVGTHAQNQSLYKKPLYNAATDFAPVALIAETPLVMVARKDLPATTCRSSSPMRDQPGQDAIRLGRHRLGQPARLRAAQRGHRRSRSRMCPIGAASRPCRT